MQVYRARPSAAWNGEVTAVQNIVNAFVDQLSLRDDDRIRYDYQTCLPCMCFPPTSPPSCTQVGARAPEHVLCTGDQSHGATSPQGSLTARPCSCRIALGARFREATSLMDDRRGDCATPDDMHLGAFVTKKVR